jgi:hypothetical protein
VLSAVTASTLDKIREQVREGLEFREAEVDKRLADLQHRLEISLKEIAAAQNEIRDADLQELQNRWSAIEPGRRKRIMEFVEDQHLLSAQARETRRSVDATTDAASEPLGGLPAVLEPEGETLRGEVEADDDQ